MIVLLLSVLLLITASFGLNTYMRLSNASKSYTSPEAFEDASHMSITYVNGGTVLMVLVILFSVCLGIFSVMKKHLR